MSKANAQRVVNVINRAIEKNTSDGARHSYKPAVAITSGSQFISAYVAGETEYASEDIRVPAGAYIGAGDYIIVGFSGEGKSWVNEILPYADYAKLVIDPNRAQVKIGTGSAEPDAGVDGQVLMSGGPTLAAYWSDNFADTVRIAVKNITGATLNAGTVVYINGASGQIPTVTKADATSDPGSSKTVGVVTKNINNNDQGTVTTFGILKNVNTSAYSEGTNLWLSTTPGDFTNVRPSAPNHGVHVGYVISQNASSGRIFVYVQNGFELGELHDVSAYAPTNGQALVWDSTSSYWKPGTISTALALDDLTDVAITTPTSGQALKYNGTAWVNGTAAAYLDDLTDVTITSAVSNEYLKYDGTKWINASSPGITFQGVRATRTYNATNNAATAAAFSNADIYDSGDFHNTSSNNTRFTAPASAYYHLTGWADFTANSTGTRRLYFRIDGTTELPYARELTPGAGTSTSLSVSDDVYLSSGQYVELMYFQNSGGTLSTDFSFTMHRLGGLTGATGATGSTGATGAGVAAGGTAGQYLKKNSASDYDTTWYTLLGSTPPSTQEFADSAVVGTSLEAAHVDHKHAMPANPVTAHEAASDPHTGYLQESVVSGFATSAITLSDTATDGTGTTGLRSNAAIAAFDATSPSTQAIGDTAVVGTANYAARRDHKHAMPSFGAVTSQTSFDGASADGTALTVAHSDHTHGTPTNPVTAHVAASDPHTGYLLESTGATQTALSTAIGATPLAVKGASGQTADIFLVENNAGTDLLVVKPDGKVGIGGTPSSELHVAGGVNRSFSLDSNGNGAHWSTYYDSMALSINRKNSDGTFSNASKAAALIYMVGQANSSKIEFYTTTSNNTNPTYRGSFEADGTFKAVAGAQFTGTVTSGGNTVPVVTSTAPTIALNATASSGTSTTALRSDATIAAFDATAPTTISFGDTAATGSINYAARRDHVHAAPANPVTAHEAAADPHTGYQKESEKAAANGYASLDASTLVPITQIPTGTSGTTVSLGNHTHAASGLSTVSSSGTATTISNTTTETDLWSFTVPANSLGSNGFVKVNMFGTMLNNSGANRAYTIRVYYGATKIFDDALANIGANASSRAWSMELTLGAANSTSSQVLAGYIAVGAVTNSTTGTGDLNTADTITQRTFYGTSAENSTGDLTFRVSIQFPANTATQTWTRSYGMAITD